MGNMRVCLAAILSMVVSSSTVANNNWCEHPSLLTQGSVAADIPMSDLLAHDLAVYYVIPSDIPYEKAVHQILVDATLDMQAWYQCASGGLTWKLAFPEVVRTYRALHPRQYYVDNGNWWGSLLGEMSEAGLPIWQAGSVVGLWARGAGFWAGGAQCGGDGNCGVALVGVELFPELNNPEWSGGECPVGAGVAAWPCTPTGAFAHELGHTMGLIHPFDDPATENVAFHSIMQTHWNYPDYAPPHEVPWGFLTVEREEIRSSSFMHSGIDLLQNYPHCDVLNLPENGPTPAASFELNAQGLSISVTNTSIGADRFYWTFGDGEVSNNESPTHTYSLSGNYMVTLRASNDASMTALNSENIEVLFKINAGLNDAWYNPMTDGQGFFINVFPDLGLASLAWFTYDTELPPIDAIANLGDPGHRWLTAIGPIESKQVPMNIVLTSGGIFDTYTSINRTDPPGSDGTILLTFDSCNSGTIEYDIPSIDRKGTVPIQRVADDNIAICEALSAD